MIALFQVFIVKFTFHICSTCIGMHLRMAALLWEHLLHKDIYQYSDLTWSSCRLKSPANRMFAQQIFQGGYNKESTIAHFWLYVNGIHRWWVDSLKKGNESRKRSSMSWRHHTVWWSQFHHGRNVSNRPDGYLLINLLHEFIHSITVRIDLASIEWWRKPTSSGENRC